MALGNAAHRLDGSLSQELLHFRPQQAQFAQHGRPLSLIQDTAGARQAHGKQVRGCNLCGEGLGAGHTDLRTCVGQDRALRITHQRRARHIADRGGARTTRSRFLQSRKSVGRLAGLADRQRQSAALDHGVAIAKLTGVIEIHRHTRDLFDHVARDHARMQRCTAAHNRHALQSAQSRIRESLAF